MDLVGGVDSRGGYISKILYVETKESGPSFILQWSFEFILNPPMFNFFQYLEARFGKNFPSLGTILK